MNSEVSSISSTVEGASETTTWTAGFGEVLWLALFNYWTATHVRRISPDLLCRLASDEVSPQGHLHDHRQIFLSMLQDFKDHCD